VQWGLGKGTKNWAIDSAHGPARAKVRIYVQRATILSKSVIPYIEYSETPHMQ
jgi:hypothetical protein